MNRLLLRSCLLLTGCVLAGCDPKVAPVPKKDQATTADKAPAETKGGQGAKGQHAAKIAALLAAYQRLPEKKDDGPLTWPVMVRVDKNHHAIPPKSAALRRHGNEERTAMLPLLETLKETWLSPKSRYVGTFTDKNGVVWHTVDHTPAHGDDSSAGAGRDGSRSSYDQQDGETTYHNKNGSTDIIDGNGDVTHIHSPNPNDDDSTDYVKTPDGGLTTYGGDGSSSHVSTDGDNDYTDNSDGSRTVYHKDGSEDTTTDDGTTFHQGPPGPGDKIDNPPSNKGPGWKNHQPGDKPAGGNGEPHYTTRDGTNITTQAAGEFVLVSAVPGHEVQARHQPWSSSQTASAITALAFRVGGSRVEVRGDNTVLIDGQAAIDGVFVQGEIPGGGAVGVWRSGGRMISTVIIWPDLSVAWINHDWAYLSFVLQWKDKAPDHRGLLGSNDGNPENDLTDRAGKLCANDAAGIAAFVESWRITDAESLFTYAPGESTATYTLKDFPHPAPMPDQKAALAAAAALPEGVLRDNCAYDIAMTGDTRFVNAYQGYAGLHGAVAASATPQALGQPDTQSVLFVTREERKNAKPLEPNSHLKETLAEGESKIYLVQAKEEADRGAYSNQLKAPQPYQAGMPGYAFFDAKGRPYGKAVPAWNDCPAFKFTPGTYYLKIVGPGMVDISINDYGK
ncbi:MAG: hypothetical protein JWO94_354 [Verrucomicrobiaceae bacterium]|nr:hypothetical protein [Verrucomicrobiaceae bacterium]